MLIVMASNALSKAKTNVNMLFGDFIELYFEDLSHCLKASILSNKHWIVDQKITPVFSKIPLNEISPTDVRKWQNKLTAIFNYAVKYYTPAAFMQGLQGHKVYSLSFI